MGSNVYRPVHQRRSVTKNVSANLGHSGRLANSAIQAMATYGIARAHRQEPRFPAGWVYRPIFSIPDRFYTDDLAGTVDAPLLATRMPKIARPYLQDVDLWCHVETEARAMLEPSAFARTHIDRVWVEQFEPLPGPVTAVHVRRGDTVTRNPPDTLNPLPAQYYIDAADDAANVVVFTDDPEWCRAELPPGWIIYEGEPGPEDFEVDYWTRERWDWVDLMLIWRIADRSGVWDSDSDGTVVMSNSSYSWLAAYLADTDRARVPSRWYGPRHLARGYRIEPLLDGRWTTVETI